MELSSGERYHGDMKLMKREYGDEAELLLHLD